MSKAGYKPEEALIFWEKMYEENKGKPRPPEWLSTHPTTPKRIAEIKEMLPEMIEIYLASEKKNTPLKPLH